MPSRAGEEGRGAELCCVHVLMCFEMLTAAARLLMVRLCQPADLRVNDLMGSLVRVRQLVIQTEVGGSISTGRTLTCTASDGEKAGITELERLFSNCGSSASGFWKRYHFNLSLNHVGY